MKHPHGPEHLSEHGSAHSPERPKLQIFDAEKHRAAKESDAKDEAEAKGEDDKEAAFQELKLFAPTIKRDLREMKEKAGVQAVLAAVSFFCAPVIGSIATQGYAWKSEGREFDGFQKDMIRFAELAKRAGINASNFEATAKGIRTPKVNLHTRLLTSIFLPIIRSGRRMNMRSDIAEAEKVLDEVLREIDHLEHSERKAA